MPQLSRQDRELLTLRGANMSTGSIAGLMGWLESRVYNRLGQLEVTSAAEALARLEGPPIRLGGWAAIGSETFAGLLAYAVWSQAPERSPEAPAAVRHAPPRSAMAKPSTIPPISNAKSRSPAIPTATTPAASSQRGVPKTMAVNHPHAPRPAPAFAIKPVGARVATWAGQFRAARWSLAEVADLFDVAEDDLAQALGEVA